ncbi:glutathione S-transferase [Rhizobiales bacterium GAS191]|nr:glutathione S-transferase [Rhizobiales bacterium GAS113]SED70423.1 glutathione S-transferase [Rhizobiales bacterium GAS188]SEE82157.1 glutathione S-transferase [Rhizobiales bacterium GAS191]
MYPAPIETLQSPTTIDEVLRQLSARDKDALPLAGGMSLMQAVKARVVRPDVLIDLNGIAELRGITKDGGNLRIGAMTRYVDPAKPLLGATPREKALVTMWERRVELEGFGAVMEGVRNAASGLKGRAIAGPHDYEQIPALVDRSRPRVGNFLSDLDTRLAGAPFVAGDRFSVADITTLATIDFAVKAFAISIPEEHRALTRWYEAVSARPSASA